MAAVDMACRLIRRGSNSLPCVHHTAGTTAATATAVAGTTAAAAAAAGHIAIVNTIYQNELTNQHEHLHGLSRTTNASNQKLETNSINDIFTEKSIKTEDSDFLKTNSESVKLKRLKIDKILDEFNCLEKNIANKTNLIHFFEQRFGDFAEMMKVQN